MITSKVRRLTLGALDGSFGPDRDKRLVVAFVPGDGDKIPDMLEIRPIRTRRTERIAVVDVYRYAIRCRVNLGVLAKARAKKEAKAQRLANERIARREKRLFKK
jgi:hypothetical protein